MKILAVHGDPLFLERLKENVRCDSNSFDIATFTDPEEAVRYTERTENIDYVILDNGFGGRVTEDLRSRLIALYPETVIISCPRNESEKRLPILQTFVVQLAEKQKTVDCAATEAPVVHVGDMDLRQESKRDAQQELKAASKPEQEPESVRVYFQCMPRFEFFVDGQPLSFTYTKTKELLAYLVNACGGVCTNKEIMAVLWDDDNNHASYYKKIRKDLTETLEEVGCSGILVRHRGGIGINRRRVDCDYYQWREVHTGKDRPEYMNQYPWAGL